MKRIFRLIMIAGLVLAFSTSCNNSEKTNKEDEKASEDNDIKAHYTFGYTCIDGSNPFFVILEKTIREQVESNGDELLTADPANDSELQITQIENMIAQDIDAIFLNPVDIEGIRPVLVKLKEAGIPVINFDTEVADLSYCESFIGSDNYNAGYICGKDLVEKRPNGGDIIILDSPAAKSVIDRVEGFLEAIEGQGFNIVAQQDAKGNIEVSMSVCENLLKKHQDVVAIFGGNDPTALGALATANAAGLVDCLIYSVDGSPEIKAELAKPASLIEATAAQSPINIAGKSVEVMYRYLAGEQIEDSYFIETSLITRENLHDFDINAWQ